MKLKHIIIILILSSTGTAYAQIRAFDNSKAILPWIYNPTADMPTDFQVYTGYDGRGKGNFTPQTFLAGARMPIAGKRSPISRTASGMAGFQVLNTSQTLINTLNVNLNYAQQLWLNNSTMVAFGIGGGIHSMSYDYDALVYMDAQDQLLNNGENSFNLHLNMGVSLVMDDKLFVNVAVPYLLKDENANFNEIIARAGYAFTLNEEAKLIPAVNLDTYNGNLIYGGDLRLEWRKILSFMAGADIYKYHGGLLLDFDAFAFGYTYGRNFSEAINSLESHQISIIGSFSNMKRR